MSMEKELVIKESLSRREWITAASVVAGATVAATSPLRGVEKAGSNKSRTKYSLNTSTIRGQKMALADEIKLAAKTGYDGIEPWMGEIAKHEKAGGSLGDIKKLASDLGIEIISGIGFAKWIVDDDAQRAAGLEQAKTDMDKLSQIGCKRIAAPPAGATRQAGMDLFKAAERYGKLLELGKKMSVRPQAEVWGFSKTLSRLGETTFVAIESKNSWAAILPDVYHLYKGGSDFEGLNLLHGGAIEVFHMNDYPADPPRSEISDAHRVYPGDGVAPLSGILKTLDKIGFSGFLSLELFNRDYWKQPADQVVKTGLAKMKQSVSKAGL
jgi:2-keto-myo-inositol isomerase